MSSKLPVAISFNGLTNLLGTMGIIGSLLFVGLELRQSHTIALGAQIQERSQMIANALLSPLQGVESAIDIFSLENSNIELSAEKEKLRGQLMRFRAVSLDNAWQQYSLGLLSEDSWQQASERGRNMWNNCFERRYVIGFFTPSLRKHAADNWRINECK